MEVWQEGRTWRLKYICRWFFFIKWPHFHSAYVYTKGAYVFLQQQYLIIDFNFILQVWGRRVPLELKLLIDVQGIHGVINALDFYETVDSFIYVMERHMHCTDLFDYITKNCQLEEQISCNFFSQIIQIVIACHERGIIHRDIKDENLLVNTKTKNLTLIDFGSGAYIKHGLFSDFDGKLLLFYYLFLISFNTIFPVSGKTLWPGEGGMEWGT